MKKALFFNSIVNRLSNEEHSLAKEGEKTQGSKSVSKVHQLLKWHEKWQMSGSRNISTQERPLLNSLDYERWSDKEKDQTNCHETATVLAPAKTTPKPRQNPDETTTKKALIFLYIVNRRARKNM